MASPADKLAASLEALHALQERGVVAIRSRDLTRAHRERLLRAGFLEQVLKGWYIAKGPDADDGDSSAWYTAYWPFCATYLSHRFAQAWCLSPEQSIALHVGNRTVPSQLLVRAAAKARNNVTPLPHGTSLLDVKSALPPEAAIEQRDGLRVYTLSAALLAVTPRHFQQSPTDMRAALSGVHDASELLHGLLNDGRSTVAGRLAGALRNIGRNRMADDLLEAMRAAGYEVRETDPFSLSPPTILGATDVSPYVNRIRLMWQAMRMHIPDVFPEAPGLPQDAQAYLKSVDDAYVFDAYHSLSIEGYQVSPALVERVRSGDWNAENHSGDREHRDALAARGYWQAHRRVKESIAHVLSSGNPGDVAESDHAGWYRELFGPAVTAGIIRAADLAGYRDQPVYIRSSMHVPPRAESLRELMPAFFDLLREEEEAAVRAVLGHFVFVYIHPYIDGNGRMGRFVMNLMMAAGGYPWTVIPVETRDRYMATLEEASSRQNIVPFAQYLAGLMKMPGDGGGLMRPG